MSPVKKHWSGVAPGQEFTFTLDYDASHEQQKVEVRMRRHTHYPIQPTCLPPKRSQPWPADALGTWESA